MTTSDLGHLTLNRRLALLATGAQHRPAASDDPLEHPRLLIPPLGEYGAEHRMLVHSVYDALNRGGVISHASAAILHGLPVWPPPPPTVELTRSAPRRAGDNNGPVRTWWTALADDEVTEIGGLRVTSAARTVIDLARTSGFGSAVVTADAALHFRLVSRGALTSALDTVRKRSGFTAARRAIEFADGRAESVGESRSRVLIELAGLPAPTLQREIRCMDGKLVARCDFCWEDGRIVGEFDGSYRYGRQVLSGPPSAAVVRGEKARQDQVRASGYLMQRWTSADLADFEPVVNRIRRGLNGSWS